jgi:hypothetical protein
VSVAAASIDTQLQRCELVATCLFTTIDLVVNRDGKHVGAQGRASACSFTRACPVSDRNRGVRTRTHGGVGPVACSLSQSRGPDFAFSKI